MAEKEIKLSSSNLYDGKVIKLFVDEVSCNGGKKAKREYVKHPGGVCILAFDENNNVLMEKQFRYPYNDFILELPAGKLEPGEDPYVAGIRELEEETGYKAESLISYGKMYPSVGYTNEIIYLYLAKNIKKGELHLDEDENLDVVRMPLDKIVGMINNNEICDAKTIILITKYLLNRKS